MYETEACKQYICLSGVDLRTGVGYMQTFWKLGIFNNNYNVQH